MFPDNSIKPTDTVQYSLWLRVQNNLLDLSNKAGITILNGAIEKRKLHPDVRITTLDNDTLQVSCIRKASHPNRQTDPPPRPQ